MASETIRTEDGIRYETRGTVATGLVYCVCEDCGRWSDAGQAILHSKRCGTPEAQPAVLAEPTTKSERKARSAASIKRAGAEGIGLTADEAFEAQQRGTITMSDAMNRDD